MPEKKFRYPGINFYLKEDKDIFCGREEDSKRLYTKVILNKTLVLHAESGTGKSSLIRAGLLPIIEENHKDYLPVIVRFDLQQNSPNVIIGNSKSSDYFLIDEAIKKIIKESPLLKIVDIPFINSDKHSLWLIAKWLAKSGKKLLLIFDQFEDIQSFSAEQIRYFSLKLAELYNLDIPEIIYTEIRKILSDKEAKDDLKQIANDLFNNNEQYLEVKTMFVLREDKLGTMSLLSDYFPDILRNEFVLKPLSISNARKAIKDPSQVEGEFHSSKFSFENDAIVEKLLREIADGETQLVDPIQVQIVCSNIERNIVIKEGKAKITKSDIPPIGDIINGFYFDNWNEVRKEVKIGDDEFIQIKKLFIQELVVNERRNIVLSGLLIKIKTKERDEEIIRILVSKGLIREIKSGKDTFYQLCHDRFIRPLLDDLSEMLNIEEFNIRMKEAEEKRKKDEEKLKLELEEKLKLAEKLRKEEETRKEEEIRKLLKETDDLRKENEARKMAEEIRIKTEEIKLKEELIAKKVEEEENSKIIARIKEIEYKRKRRINIVIIISLSIGSIFLLLSSFFTYIYYTTAENERIKFSNYSKQLKEQVRKEDSLNKQMEIALNKYETADSNQKMLQIDQLINTASLFIAAKEFQDTTEIFKKIRLIKNSPEVLKKIDSLKNNR